MTRPRNQQICIEDTPYYHVVSRCVRRTYLCGIDHETGKSFEHRRQWIEDRIRLLASIFCVEICAFAVMSNHLHIVIKLNPEEIDSLSETQVIQRWTCLFKGPILIQKMQNGDALSSAELTAIGDITEVYRKRLATLSWFMKCLNEPIARQANKEDGCTGHFWEARYKSQALLTEAALISCMAYVDLNPVRAKMAETPEESDHTSIKERINPSFSLSKAVKTQIELEALQRFDLPLKPLLHFEPTVTDNGQKGILYSMQDYLELVDFTGRCIRNDNKGFISNNLPPILTRLNIDKNIWLNNAMHFEKNYRAKFSKRIILKNTSG